MNYQLLGELLHFQIPSFHSTQQTISDGTDHINPASLRGLGPDQVLVLVNGKRRHSSSLVNINGTVGKGTVATDLDAIPLNAIGVVLGQSGNFYPFGNFLNQSRIYNHSGIKLNNTGSVALQVQASVETASTVNFSVYVAGNIFLKSGSGGYITPIELQQPIRRIKSISSDAISQKFPNNKR